MKCSKAIYLMSQDIDGVISSSEAAELTAHLDECSSCAVYYEHLRQSISLLDIHSAKISVASSKLNLDNVVHKALAEHLSPGCDAAKPLSTLIESLRCLLSARVWSAVRVVSVGVLLFISSYILVCRVVDVDPHNTGPLTFGRIESFSAETDSEGRVYASVIERNSTHADDKGGVK